MTKLRRIILLAILFMIVAVVVKTLNDSGTFKKLSPHFDGTTEKVMGVVGVEDLTIDQETGLALLSSDDRWAYMIDKKPKKGGIFLLDLKDSASKVVELTKNFNREDFHPHGISLVKLSDGRKRLFVINHPRLQKDTPNTIEIFDWQDSVLIHQETLKNPTYLPSPNDLVAVGERQFYVSNDHDSPPSFLRGIGDFLQWGTGYVSYYNGTKWEKTLASGIKYSNGITVNAEGTKLFLAGTTSRTLYVYDINPSSGAISPSDEIYLNTGVDNLEWDTEGNIWIGCHPQMLKFLSHAKDPKELSPSQVIRVNYQGKDAYTVDEIYLNLGDQLSASSVGAVYQNQLLIGGVFQHHILRCRFNKP